ncbi:MAG TPA: hypothetical protein VJP02_25025 [Candidatus Sulfotelmatobacter sp.]|nr:hypothetical protein [Candidatus Sulfotelmatobacter sp.]
MGLGVSRSEFSIELPEAVKKRVAALEDGLYFIPLSHIHYVLSERPSAPAKKVGTATTVSGSRKASGANV